MRTRHFYLPLFVLLLCPAISFAQRPESRIRKSYLWPIVIQKGEIVADAVCYGCSITVRGRVLGDAISFWGEVVLEEGAIVNGDATAVFGGIRLGANSVVGGDADSIGVMVERDPTSAVTGTTEADLDLPNRWALFGAIILLNMSVATVAFMFLLRRAANLALIWNTRKVLVCIVGGLFFGVWCGCIPLTIRYFPAYIGYILGGLFLFLMFLCIPGYTGLSLWIGRRILRAESFKRWGNLFCGALVISIGQLLPVIGPVLYVIFISLSLGTTLVGRFGFKKIRHSAKVPAPA